MIPSKRFPIVIILGKSGSGKGTQAKLLSDKTGFHIVSSGKLLRSRIKKKDFLGKKLRKIIYGGGLAPSPLIFHLWLHEFERLLPQRKIKGLIFEGSPRKLYEAFLLDEVLEFYSANKNMRVVHIQLSNKEARKRLHKRGRVDDELNEVNKRLRWFKIEVTPTVKHYRMEKILVEVNGEQSVEKVHQEIMRKLKTFLM
ncbi:nucleoside monophosphate kinase [Patescibacteria group bacterium]|nr:nucleoside monophosphate kinase [Patescibacteria group bacterium]